MTDPRDLTKGTVMVHLPSGSAVVLDHRKDDDTGWWNTDRSGLADRVFAHEDWATLHDVVARLDLAEAVCRSCRWVTEDGTEDGEPIEVGYDGVALDAWRELVT